MIKHTLILALSACLAYSQQYGAYGEPQRGKPLHFSDIAKHFDSVTSQSTSLRDLEKVVEPALDKIRRRRSDDDVKDSVRKVVEAGLETADDIDPDSLQDNGSAFRNMATAAEAQERSYPSEGSSFVDKLDIASQQAKQLLASLTNIFEEISVAFRSFSPLSLLSGLLRRRRSLESEEYPVLARSTRGIKDLIEKIKAKLLTFFENNVEPWLIRIKEAFKRLLSPRIKRSPEDKMEQHRSERKDKSKPRSMPPQDDDSGHQAVPFRRKRGASTESPSLGQRITSENPNVTREKREAMSIRPDLSRSKLKNTRRRRNAGPQNANGIFLGALNNGEEGTFRTPDMKSINATAK